MSDQVTIGVLALQGDVREHVRMLDSCGARGVPVRRVEELSAVDGLIIPGGESTTIIKLATAFDLLEPLRKRVAEDMPTFGTCAGMIMLADRIEDGIAGQETIGGIDMTVRRNAFGRQVDSFEESVEFDGLSEPIHAVFIRAPWVESVGPRCDVLASLTTGPDSESVPAGRVSPRGRRSSEQRDRAAVARRRRSEYRVCIRDDDNAASVDADRRESGDSPRTYSSRIVAVRQGQLLATSFHPELTGDHRIHEYFVRLVKEA